jgi:hypothetical protein
VGKNSMLKAGGFITTLAAGAALVGAAVTGTGAYFTDSQDGVISASTGHLRLNTTDTNLSFDDLVPGEDKTRHIEYNVDASGKSDVWLVFDKTNLGYAQWTGAKGDSLFPAGGFGRYGHFAVASNGGTLFQSWNLQNLPAGGSDAVCDVNANGHGAGRPATSRADTPPLCGVPTAIKLASNLSSGQRGTLSMTFGVTGRWQAQDITLPSVPFKVVATQAGVHPNAEHF